MSAQWDILGIGVVAVDDLVYVDRFPLPDSKMEISGKRREGGGLTATAMVAAARLGARTAYSTILGDDELSQFTVQSLEREGVDCSPILYQAGARPYHSIIIVERPTGHRSILYSTEGVMRRQPAEMTEAMVTNCRLLFVDHLVAEAALRAIELGRTRGIPVVADIEDETGPAVTALMAQVDHLIVGIELAGRVTGESEPERMVQALDSPHRLCSVVTAGDRGCWYKVRGEAGRHYPAFQVRAVDTTGCGDVFHGAYAACIARGESIATAIQVATATAGLKATRPGGRAGIPDRPTVDRFLVEKGHDPAA